MQILQQSKPIHFRFGYDPDESSEEEQDSYSSESEEKEEDSTNLRVSGLFLEYLDGSEVEIGLVEGSAKSVTVNLSEDEHLTSVSQRTDKTGIISIRCVTSY
jgi:hypothetical protein